MRQKSETKTNLKKSSRICLKSDAEELEMMKALHQRITAKKRKEDEQATNVENLFGSMVAAELKELLFLFYLIVPNMKLET